MRYVLALWRRMLVAAALAMPGAAVAQHSDVLLQRGGNKIVTGSANFTEFSWTIGARVFARDFDGDYLIDNPGYNALSSSSPFLPMGYSALPASSPVGWDFLPMKIEDTVANLMYWNGSDTNANGVDVADVMFDQAAGYSLSIHGAGGLAAADGSARLLPGTTLVMTDSSGAIHSHRAYHLDDGDMNAGTNPADGIYVIALRVRMETLQNSDPFYLVFGPPATTFLAARNAAVAWVQARLDTLAVIPLSGDYNFDGAVDAADYVVWRNTLASTTELAADGDLSGTVDAADYGVWRANFGATMAGATSQLVPDAGALPQPPIALTKGVAVPEGTTLGLVLVSWCCATMSIFRRPTIARGPAAREAIRRPVRCRTCMSTSRARPPDRS